MNQDSSNHPEGAPDFSDVAARVAAGIRTRQTHLQVLTGAAFLLGFLAVAASILIVVAYFVIYRPKEKEVLRQVTLAAEHARAEQGANRQAQGEAGEGGGAPASKLPFDFPSVQATMTFFHSILLTGLAGAVGILALGTLVLLAMVILSRRATLQQINVSLAQISAHLRQLQATPGQK